MANRSGRFYLGIDVGTGSARAGIFDAEGKRVGLGKTDIAVFKPKVDFYEHSSEDIWTACGKAVRAAVAEAGIDPRTIAGIGFDATCSLVLLDRDDAPVTASPTGHDAQNIIVWMDHRALDQTTRINALGRVPGPPAPRQCFATSARSSRPRCRPRSFYG